MKPFLSGASILGKPLFIIICCKHLLQNPFSTLHLLNDWVNNEHVIFDDDILRNLREFLASVNATKLEELDKLVLEILHRIRELVRMHALPYVMLLSK